MPDSFVEIEVETDADALFELAVEGMQEEFPGWEPADGDPDTRKLRVMARTAAELAEVAVDVPAEIFDVFGSSVVGVPRLEAVAATATTTWTADDDAGYTIPAGTQVEIPVTGSQRVGFRTVGEVSIPPGETQTDAGEVVIRALIEGIAGNELDANPLLIDALGFVESIELVTTTSGGVEAETPSAYIDRLSKEMELFTRAPILPRDVEIVVRRIAGIARATAIDGFNPADSTTDNERMVTVAVIDEAGQAVAAPVKAAAEALLEATREINFVFHVIDPTYTEVDVDWTFVALEGFDEATVAVNLEAATAGYLSPELWGVGEDPVSWRNVTSIYLNELIAMGDRVTGVDRIVSVEISESGDPTTAANLALDGAAPLPAPGTINATAV